jgi:hypothetical protein
MALQTPHERDYMSIKNQYPAQQITNSVTFTARSRFNGTFDTGTQPQGPSLGP